MEALEHRWEIGLDAVQREEFLVELGIALLAVPTESVFLVAKATTLDHQADRIRAALR